jgi:hypothetical protein
LLIDLWGATISADGMYAIGAAVSWACAPGPADLTDREAVTAWGYGRANHMINSGQFLVQPPEPPAETVPARPRAPPAVRRWDRSRRVRRPVRPAQKGGTSIGAIAMRSVFALGLLIILCVSADAATVHRSKPSTVHIRTRQHVIVRPSQGVTAPRALRRPGVDRIGWITPPPARAADSATRAPMHLRAVHVAVVDVPAFFAGNGTVAAG